MPTPTHGSVLLASTDVNRLRSWYEKAFGAGPNPDGFLRFGGVSVLIDARGDVAERAAEPERVILNLHVDDARAVAAHLDSLGVTWVVPVEYRTDAWFGRRSVRHPHADGLGGRRHRRRRGRASGPRRRGRGVRPVRSPDRRRHRRHRTIRPRKAASGARGFTTAKETSSASASPPAPSGNYDGLDFSRTPCSNPFSVSNPSLRRFCTENGSAHGSGLKATGQNIGQQVVIDGHPATVGQAPPAAHVGRKRPLAAIGHLPSRGDRCLARWARRPDLSLGDATPSNRRCAAAARVLPRSTAGQSARQTENPWWLPGTCPSWPSAPSWASGTMWCWA